jgi:hypothetical protein
MQIDDDYPLPTARELAELYHHFGHRTWGAHQLTPIVQVANR